MDGIKGKKILLIVPKFYGYEIEIKRALKKAGATVVTIYENIVVYNLYYRMFHVYFNSKSEEIIYNYYKRCLKKIGMKKIDIVFAIRASSINDDIYSMIKEYCNSDCRFIMYQWDSVANNPRAKQLADLFDNVYTFDINDSANLGWEYRPLFFISDMVHASNNRSIDVSFLCSWHSQRAEILKRLKEITSKGNLTFYYNMRAPFLLFVKNKYLNKRPEYNTIGFGDIRFKVLPLKRCYSIYGSSKVVVDYTHPGQTGLTMRTIECLGSECKLVTNNKLIEDADFFNPNNIIVYDGEDIDIPIDFISAPYVRLPDSIYSYYSIESWLESIFK